ncbi:lipid-binding SYLF domain-containing protein [Janthinobacterium sp. GB1R12]|uniref:lipid-binding SYLF domain-containing protein n=1 Tax=Janthinobacterium sp. GB1R12 TaxID=3424190 RepID=UPI003F1F933A
MSIGNHCRQVAAACLFMLLASGVAVAQSNGRQSSAPDLANKAMESANKRVEAAIPVVHELQADAGMQPLLQQAKGILIVPSYGRAALGVGAQGGGGLLLIRGPNGNWSGPAFYNLGGLTLGLQAGAEGGPIVMVLNNDKAVNAVMKKNNFSLNAAAGLTVVNWRKMAQGTVGIGDVVAWSGTKGLFGDVVAVGLSDIRFNQHLTDAFYGRTLSPKDFATGNIDDPHALPLQLALDAASAAPK